MLTINTRNDKLAAARIDFSSRGMLDGTCLSEALENLQNTSEDEDTSSEGSSDGGSDDGQDLDADEDEDRTGPVDGPPTLSDVTLARKGGKSCLFLRVPNRSLKVYTARGYPLTSFQELGQHIKQENLESLIRIFLFYQQNPTFAGTPPISACPTVEFVEDISVFHSAKVIFCTPSNPSGVEFGG